MRRAYKPLARGPFRRTVDGTVYYVDGRTWVKIENIKNPRTRELVMQAIQNLEQKDVDSLFLNS